MNTCGRQMKLLVLFISFWLPGLLAAQTPRPPAKSNGNPASRPNQNPPAQNPPGAASGNTKSSNSSRPNAANGPHKKPNTDGEVGKEQTDPDRNGQALGTRTQSKKPNWFPLSAENQSYVDEVLDIWEKKSSTVQRFRCNFVRYQYQPAFGPHIVGADGKLGELRPAVRENGVINYKAPSKGMLRVDKIESNRLPPGATDDEWNVVKDPGDYWMCDGDSVFYLNHQDKQLIERALPPGMKGKFIQNGPLPFVFGAQASELKQRFWIRPMPSDAANEAKLEFVPRTPRDSADFLLVQVILEETKKHELLPKAIRILDPAGQEQSYVFTDREYNWNEAIDKLGNLFKKGFDTPVAPKGYKRVVEAQLPSEAVAPVPNNRRAEENRTPKTKPR